MNNRDRVIVFISGLLIGLVLVSIIVNRRKAAELVAVDPWVAHNHSAIAAGAEPLPEAVPQSMTQGRILDFGFLPDETRPEERVWLMNFDGSYPYVRIVQQVDTGELAYMAADQILINLADGVDVTELKPMLETLGLRLRMFNRKDQLAVIGVLSTRIDAVPATLDAVRAYSDLFKDAEPDFIRFQRK